MYDKKENQFQSHILVIMALGRLTSYKFAKIPFFNILKRDLSNCWKFFSKE